MLLKELLQEWLLENHKFEIKERTTLRYECIINIHIKGSIIDEEDIDLLSPRLIQKFINNLKNTKSNKTNKLLSSSSINCAITVLKLAFEYANTYEITQNNPMLRIKRIKINQIKKAEAFTRKEQIKLEKYLDELNNYEYFGYLLDLYTGIRLGELLALTWKDINLKTGIMTINKTQYVSKKNDGTWKDTISTPKTLKSYREIPLPTFLKDKLIEYKKFKKSNKVIAKLDGTKLSQKCFISRYHKLLKKIGIRDLNFHSIRHTFATRALENNMDIKTLSEILGHSNASTTLNIYAHSLIDHKRQQMKKLKRLI